MINVYTVTTESPLIEASFGGLLRTLFWIVVSFYIFRLITRVAVTYAVNKTQQELHNQRAFYEEQARKQSKSRGNTIPEAEDVDYIEIKED
jgi:hypothetical protein